MAAAAAVVAHAMRSTSSVTPGQNISFVVGTGGGEAATIAGGLNVLANAGANTGSAVAKPDLGGWRCRGTTAADKCRTRAAPVVADTGPAPVAAVALLPVPMGAGGPGGNTMR